MENDTFTLLGLLTEVWYIFLLMKDIVYLLLYKSKLMTVSSKTLKALSRHTELLDLDVERETQTWVVTVICMSIKLNFLFFLHESRNWVQHSYTYLWKLYYTLTHTWKDTTSAVNSVTSLHPMKQTEQILSPFYQKI